jgi:hypothetical protein
MWVAGRYCATYNDMKVMELIKSVGLLVLAASVAFAISNGSFYLFSGRFEGLSLVEYFVRVAKYYTSYVGASMIYGVAGLATLKALNLLSQLQSSHKAV